MKTTTLLLAALLAGGALVALAPAATAWGYEVCHGETSTVEVCYSKELTIPDCLVGVHTSSRDVDVCWT